MPVMSHETAERVADVLLGAAVLGAALVILRTPTLRKLAVGLATAALATGLPAWLKGEVQQAWAASAPAPR